MRRSEKEITDFGEIIEIISRCDVCRLAFPNGEYPYIVPVNFGFLLEDGCLQLIFHSAHAGKKIELLKTNNRVAFEMDCACKVILGEQACESTMQYQSVCGYGLVSVVPVAEKPAALAVIMDHYAPGQVYGFAPAAIENTALLKLTVIGMTAKQSPGERT